MTTNTGGPAFPSHGTMGEVTHEGMTLRDYFAAKALEGFCGNPAVFAPNSMSGWGLVNCTEKQLADYCNVLADAMLKARDA